MIDAAEQWLSRCRARRPEEVSFPMSQDVRIAARTRDQFGKGASRQYRRGGEVPAVVYGGGAEVRHVLLPEHELGLALRIPRVVLQVGLDGETLAAAPRDVQRDPVRQSLHHVDLLLLSRADVAERHAYADALARAEAAAEEAGQDPMQVAAIIEEAAANDEDLSTIADRIVEILEEQARLRAEASAAAEAREEEAAAAEGAEVGEAADEAAAEASSE